MFNIEILKRTEVIVIAVAVALILLLQLFKQTPTQVTVPEPVVLVDTIVLKKQHAAPSLQLYAKIESPRNAKLKAPITAYVQATPGLEGRIVAKGSLLVSLDARDINHIVQARRGTVNSLHASIEEEKLQFAADQDALQHEQSLVKLAEHEVARHAHLVKTRAGAQSILDQAQQSLSQHHLRLTARKLAIGNHQNRLQRLQAQLSEAKAALAQAELDKKRSQVRAPFAGRITQLHVAVGDRVNPGEPIVEMFDTNLVELRAQIPTRYLATVNKMIANKQHLTATAMLNGKAHHLYLARLSGEVAPTRAGVDGLFRLKEHDVYLSLGHTVELMLTLPKEKDVFVVPVSAVYDAARVYKVVNERLQVANIEQIGTRVGEAGVPQAVIRSVALKTNDVIIITQLPQAITGMAVKVNRQGGGHG